MLNIHYTLFSSLPILIVGAIVGAVQFLHIDKSDVSGADFSSKLKLFIKTSATSGVLALSCFLMTDNFDLTYSSRVGISIFVAFAGYEKVQSIIDKLLDNISHKNKACKM